MSKCLKVNFSLEIDGISILLQEWWTDSDDFKKYAYMHQLAVFLAYLQA